MRRDDAHREKVGSRRSRGSRKKREEREEDMGDMKEQLVQNPGKPVEHELYPTHNELSHQPSMSGSQLIMRWKENLRKRNLNM
jgi:hypothetical protein